ncbi:dTMP kinase [Microbacterium sp. W4I4]|uniref:dTMP kinase n=1 Tax=Microbacterium sp. W4I4 TaxID=3042295 RepID=UPI00278A4EC2|nr:hypothetical protein [Microbacterium sp. W4I4]MDQ0612395.1 dTMP kinase [Microbacterium sp. W4I4]
MSAASIIIRPGAVIVFEGLDQTGKSTQLKRLQAAVPANSTVFAHMPSGFTTFTKQVYTALEGVADAERPRSGLAQQLAHLACHAEAICHLEEAVRTQSLILDRWWWSTLAYGWYGGSVEQSGLSESSFRELVHTIWNPIVPSVVFIFLEPHLVDDNNTQGVKTGYRALIDEHHDLTVIVPSAGEDATHTLITDALLARGLASIAEDA